MLKVLHTADWQLGEEFGGFEPADSAILSEARTLVVRRIAELAREHAVDLVTVAGDVFDSVTVREKILRQCFDATRIHPCPWAIIPGNHDPALPESAWTQALRIGAVPEHVHLCLKPEPLELLDGRVVVLPAPLTQVATHVDATEWFDTAETSAGALRIGLAHGSVTNQLPEGAGRNNPIAEDRATRARLDALLLGDWHGYMQIGDRTFYSGTPETNRFVNNLSGNVVLLEFDGAGPPRPTVLRSGRYRWQTIEPLLSTPMDVEDVIGQLDALGEDDVVLFRPTGRVTLIDNRRLCDAKGRAQSRVRAFKEHMGALRIMATSEDIDALKADGYVARVIDRLRDEEANEASPEQATVSREALVLLANLLDTRGTEGAAVCE